MTAAAEIEALSGLRPRAASPRRHTRPQADRLTAPQLDPAGLSRSAFGGLLASRATPPPDDATVQARAFRRALAANADPSRPDIEAAFGWGGIPAARDYAATRAAALLAESSALVDRAVSLFLLAKEADAIEAGEPFDPHRAGLAGEFAAFAAGNGGTNAR